MIGRSTNSSRSTDYVATSARVMALVVHPYIMGAPHRLKYLRKVLQVIGGRDDVLIWTRRADLRLVSVAESDRLCMTANILNERR